MQRSFLFQTGIANARPAPNGRYLCQLAAQWRSPGRRTGGAVLPRAVAQRFESRTGILLYETYGMTETAAAIAFNPGRGERLPGSVGFRVPHSEIVIAKHDESEGWSACPPKVSGSVLVRGRQVFSGYVDVGPDTGVLSSGGWLVTGDIGYLTDDPRHLS